MDSVSNQTAVGARRAAWVRRGLAVLSAALLTLAFPPLGLWWLAWLALTPWYAALTLPRLREGESRYRRAGAGFFFGLTLFLVGMYWMNEIGGVPWFALAVVQGTFFAVLGAACVRLLPRLPAWARPLVFAALWTLFEAGRSWGKVAFPWFVLTMSQVRALPLLQIVSVTGQWGLSFAVAAVNGYAFEAWRARGAERVRWAGVAAAVPAALALFGMAAMRAVPAGDGRPVPVAIAQGSEKYRDEILPTYTGLTRQAAGTPGRDGLPLYVVWPEGTVPGDMANSPGLYRYIADLAESVQTPLIVGGDEQDRENRHWRVARLIGTDGQTKGRYAKQQLVPFGEFFPGREFLGDIYARYGGDYPDFTPGNEAGVYKVPGRSAGDPGVTVGLLICYEDAFPYVSRINARLGAEVLTYLTSDQSFGTSAGPYQHFDMSLVRAIETRRYVVRAATTGVSALVSPTGEVLSRLPIGERGVLAVSPKVRTDITPFVRLGDWWLLVCTALAAWGTGLVFRSRRQETIP